MTSKHFISSEDVACLVPDALESLTFQHPGLLLDPKHKIIYSVHHDAESRVCLISGGGAGHEPAHAMYVGTGMLSAAVSGNIFASPGVRQIYKCIKKSGGKAGTLLIVKNYTGDVFNFHQAALKARAELGLRVEVVVVGDDVSLTRTKVGRVGRRGLAGTVLMHKILGGMAAAEKSLDDCLDVSKRVNDGLATIGVSLGHVHIPGQAPAQDQLSVDEIELGMGIHNEPGAQSLKPAPTISELLDLMLQRLLSTSDSERGYVDFSDCRDVVVLVNNLGSLSVLELSAISAKIIRKLGLLGVKPRRTYSGTFMTSLDGPGFSLTLLRADPEIISYLDAPTSALGWSVGSEWDLDLPRDHTIVDDDEVPENRSELAGTGAKVNTEVLKKAISRACRSGIAAVPSITHFDTIVGDGDCGITLGRGCEAVLRLYEDTSDVSDDALENLLCIARAVEDSMDGTSGAIYGLFFNGFASSLRDSGSCRTMGQANWIAAAEAGLRAVQSVTPARTGDRTLMDALEPFVQTLESGLPEAVDAARTGAEKTKGLKPAFGRAVYVNEEGWDQVPDPGAMGIVALVEGLAMGLVE